MTVTLIDVAQAAGVSRSTASRALSGSSLISAETRAAVEHAARALGYRPNRAASALRSNRSHLIGLVMNNLINATFHTVAEVVQKRASASGFQVLLCITDADPGKENDVLSMLGEHGVDGTIVIGSGRSADASNALLSAGRGVVNLIRSVRGSGAPTVLADDLEGAKEATAHLLSLGHTRIGYIGGPADATSGRERFDGYCRALADAGVDVDEGLIRKGPFTTEFGAEAVNLLLDDARPMTALYAANHEAVFGILPTLSARGVSIPDSLSLVCHEDMPWLKMWQPPVTVVDNGAAQLANVAMDLLFQQINDAAVPDGRTYRIGARLVDRDSCRPERS
ncbi:LacI family DNA-binding transcriptional regulator [Rhodococcus sp. BP-252]|uniref:Transcriptional regulator n=1 Tax=Rhodococcoides kyotonense TaxID=398843 RepID=A0A177Y7K0_9NOCA|nr:MULTISPECIES: LacI family DNA-binding transcriptional regulator [Rhodococcus]MBY6410397.1 LacI family DNA-binding transcriptional regulator [Rhodococcus sp. BP-320]MBY6416279.1 LacI family DNA-binding transcriptional regulator [Rhodococcus sp. BP-321]MBY6420274.1 LacI family DNA-binding transcriptional regulator [Rhodococcus sp. BP-324]MBY6424953.1 LacI family DNA-binding transcriptional regulator [Rhodococcus sp. BP-323]MBY6430341.1 LacI family DNA-binding transcriptional regulator [Rhodoc